MGSKGSKPRKPTHSQHLPKVGSHESHAQHQEMHDEQRAVLDTLGVSAAPLWVKVTVLVVGVALLVAAIWSLLF
jgi:hypothetical protein